MTYQVTGTVGFPSRELSSSSNDYFSGFIYSNLSVKVYEITLADETEIASTGVNNNATFAINVDTNAVAIIIKLYVAEGKDRVLLAESQLYCRHETPNVNFTVNEALSGTDVFHKVLGRLDRAGADSDQAVAGLSDDEIDRLDCMTCVTAATLKRVSLAYNLWTAYNSLVPFGDLPEAYAAARVAATGLAALGNETGRQLVFALIGSKPNATLSDVFSYSADDLNKTINASVAKNEIAASAGTGTNIGLLAGAGNAVLLMPAIVS